MPGIYSGGDIKKIENCRASQLDLFDLLEIKISIQDTSYSTLRNILYTQPKLTEDMGFDYSSVFFLLHYRYK